MDDSLKIRRICRFAQLRKGVDGCAAIYCTGGYGKNAPNIRRFWKINPGEVCLATRFTEIEKNQYVSFVNYAKMELCEYKERYTPGCLENKNSLGIFNLPLRDFFDKKRFLFQKKKLAWQKN